MTKQELAHIAKVMYDLQEYCRWVNGGEHFNPYDKQCGKCALRFEDCSFNKSSFNKSSIIINKSPIIMPLYWDITKADIERLEREGK